MDLEKFLEIEKQFGLLEENVDGFYFWIYARAEIQWYIRDKIYSYTAYHPLVVSTFWGKLKLRIQMVLNALLRGHIPRDEQNMLVLNSSRKVWVDDHYECIYTDDIVREMGNAIVLESPYEQKHFTPFVTPNLVYLDGIEIKAQLYYYFNSIIRKKTYRNIEKQIFQKIKRPMEALATIYNVTVDCNDVLKFIMPEFFKYQVKKKNYTKIVKKVMPKVVLEVDSYSADCMIMNEVAKNRNIPVVELQHGVTGKNHIAYNYPAHVKVCQFPDYLFVFSDFWKREIRYPIKKENVIATGFPYLEKQKVRYQKNNNEKKEKIVLLFLSQGIVGKYLAEMAITVAKQLNMNHYHIIFKLHPDEYATWKTMFPDLVHAHGIEVIDNSRRSLYELFAEADVQIGFTSTSIYEGLIYNLDTYIYVRNNNPEMEDLLKLGYANKFTSASELVELIGKREENTTTNINELWKADALNNIIKQLYMIIDKERCIPR